MSVNTFPEDNPVDDSDNNPRSLQTPTTMSVSTGSLDNVFDDINPLVQTTPTHISHVDKAKTRWITVEPIIFLAFVGLGSFATIRAEYLQNRIATDVYNYTFPTDSNGSCGLANTSHPDSIIKKEIQHKTANWSLYLNICSTLPLIFSTIVIGKWSDIKGRKATLLVPLFGMLVQSSVYLVVIYLHLSMSLLYIAEIAFGLTGGGPLLVSISLAYIADITTSKQRTFRIVIVETCLLFSIGVAQLTIGYLIAAKGFIPPFYLLISCQIAAILYTAIPNLLYESTELKTSIESFIYQMSKLFHGIFDLFVYNEDNRRWRLLLTNVMLVPIMIVIYGYHTTITLYVIGEPFCWSSVLVGIFNAVALGIFSIGKCINTNPFQRVQQISTADDEK